MRVIHDSRPPWIMVSKMLHPTECEMLMIDAEDQGYRPGTYADGSFRDNVSVSFIEKDRVVPEIWGKLCDYGERCAAMLGIAVWTGRAESLQISKWGPGDKYGWHKDHDDTGVLLACDRKLTMYISLTEGGGLHLDQTGMVHCGTGDALVFSAQLSHAAPEQKEGERISTVLWIPGPRWR